MVLGIPLPTTPGTPLPYPTSVARYRMALTGPAQRLALSVKTAVSGSPIYRCGHAGLSECVGERTLGKVYSQNVPSFLIDL